jgi:hypothetical protein
MATLELTADESGMLRAILESYLSDLRMEIADTDSMDYREMLKAKEVFLKKVIPSL